MASARGDLFQFNRIRTATVVQQLRQILTQYPDNGTIIKELVQNAEDAGASRVEVVHDTRDLHFPDAHQQLVHFVQGPALCIYNDSLFSQDDWDGICRLSDSIKKNDPLKIGRFGLGFKSVFHMTDHVTVVSGGKVLLMDPCQPEDEMCCWLDLSRLTSVLPPHDCQQLWGRYLTAEHLQRGHFPATLFWFPLRQKPSQVSRTIYSSSNITCLFKSFGVEASYCLIFLTSLETVILKQVTSSARASTTLHEVLLVGGNLAKVRKKREDFRQQLKQCNGSPSQPLSCNYEITVKTVEGEKNEQQTWRILHYLPIRSDVCTLADEEFENEEHIPLVGVAASTSVSDSNAQGHLFCFLPLPLDPSNMTGLPVHLNASFILDHNRRHVKWRTAESSDQQFDVRWNERLVSVAAMVAYRKLLEAGLQEAQQHLVSAPAWYSMLPALTRLSGRWYDMAIAVWRTLATMPIIYSETQGFLTPRSITIEGQLSDVGADVAKRVRDFLVYHDLPLASPPPSIIASLSDIGVSVATVTPSLVSKTLRKVQTVEEHYRLSLLEYVLSDEKYKNLEGLPLLPLESGCWRRFSTTGGRVYVCSEDEAEVFLGQSDEILRTDLPTAVYRRLREAAQKGVTQLKQFEWEEDCVEVLSSSVEYIRQGHVSDAKVETWLRRVWSLLQGVDLSTVSSLPVVPSGSSHKELLSLDSVIVKQIPSHPLSSAQVQALSHLSVLVVPSLPDYVTHRQLRHYVFESHLSGVTLALLKVAEKYSLSHLAAAFNKHCTNAHSQEFCGLIDLNSLQDKLKLLLRKLNIFKATDKYNTEHYMSIENVNTVAPRLDDFPVRLPKTLITPLTHHSKDLAKRLGAHVLSKEDLCLEALESTYPDSEIIKLAYYILKDYIMLQSASICQKLRQKRFVVGVHGELYQPCQLYDPEHGDNDVLIGEKFIPAKSLKKYYPLLRMLGMRTLENMPQQQLIQIIREMQAKQLMLEERRKKSAAVLRVLNHRSDCRQVCEAVAGVPFVCGEINPPSHYPDNLSWATKSELYAPSELKSYEKYQDIVGSVVALVSCAHIEQVAQSFGWNQDPSAEHSVSQLKEIMNGCEPLEVGNIQVIRSIYLHLSSLVGTKEAPSLKSLASLASVYTDCGFKHPIHVYISTTDDDISLLPLMHPLPSYLHRCADLFKFLGCFEKQSVAMLVCCLQMLKEWNSLRTISTHRVKQLILSILEKVKDSAEHIPLSQLLLPVESEDGGLELVERDLCYYSEQNEWLDSEELGVKLVADFVSTELAARLGVAPLRRHLAAGGEALLEWGQQENLIKRLHNLLIHQYRDGVAILKELVQNADDAGATCVSFLYDQRQNEDAHSMLLNVKLKECQGPALWAYNDAYFTEDDFSDLRDLGGGTKEYQSTKIGKFGLGFNSVYNLTDVPGFVSGTSYVIFDPQVSYLDSPGVRFNFKHEKNLYMLKKLKGQFQPFHQVFGCSVQEDKNFHGTLFRFPLRTPSQAAVSKLSNIHYTEKEMMKLLLMFRNVVGELLLFTQNVIEIRVFHLANGASSPVEQQLLFQSVRSDGNTKACQSSNLNDTLTPMKRAAALFDRNKNYELKWRGDILEYTTMPDIEVHCTEHGQIMCGGVKERKTVKWMISWHSGHGTLCKVAEKFSGKALPLSAVAVPLSRQSDGWQPIPLSNLPQGFYRKGHLHCFLPLPVTTDLAVQVNGFFEVESSRTSLQRQNEDDRHELSWNRVLLHDAVSSAFHTLLLSLAEYGLCQKCPYYGLWPVRNNKMDEFMKLLVMGFYEGIVDNDLKVFRSRDEWHGLSSCRFLHGNLQSCKEVGEIAYEYMETLFKTLDNVNIIKMPENISLGFKPKTVSKYCITSKEFYQEYFLPNLNKEIIDSEKRDKLTLHMIDNCFVESLEEVSCIPTQPHGTVTPPQQLIDPRSAAARMFTENDQRFPFPAFVNSFERREKLLKFGMKSDDIPVEWVCERVASVSKLPCSHCAVHRAENILQYINSKSHEEQAEIARRISTIPFLPVMQKPTDWPFDWYGESYPLHQTSFCKDHAKSKITAVAFAASSDIYLTKFKMLVGSCHPLLDYISVVPYITVLRQLGVVMDLTDLPLPSVVYQLREYSHRSVIDESSKNGCYAIYEHLEGCLKDSDSDTEAIIQALINEDILVTTTHGFKKPKLFALSSDVDCSPDLFSAQNENLNRYRRLMKALEVEQNFAYDVVKEMLLKKKEKYGEKQLNSQDVIQMSKLLGELFRVREADCSEYGRADPDIYLPDTSGRLFSTRELCTEDGKHLSSGHFKCLHKSISVSQEMLEWLGIKSKSRRRLEESSTRLRFGQKVKLITRLKNILHEYPCDGTIMKELLQNADDAGASKVAFIKDFRQLPEERLLDKQWAPLQGPALAVYNNKGFSEDDLRSIQDLGDSFKRGDPACTGQYGIGFNVVYHLTDAPSFLTRGPSLPYHETLCMFDPHCWYDPLASPEEPGVQLKDLKKLREDHPDSFLGYLEELIQDEGTVFRLPLRVRDDSSISGNVIHPQDIERILNGYKGEMAKCLIFLKNVREISIMKVTQDGKLQVEYSVQSFISPEIERKISLRQQSLRDRTGPCKYEMVRDCYEMKIMDTHGQTFHWYVVQQLGTDTPNSVPEIVKEACRRVPLLPHAGAAVLLKYTTTSAREKFLSLHDLQNLQTTSCYLPLPAVSGLLFSVNGHFTLNSSRQDLWSNEGDTLDKWNMWLMEEVLVPAAAHALNFLRIRLFSSMNTAEPHVTKSFYEANIKYFHTFLPDAIAVRAAKWKRFVKLFYKYVMANNQLRYFDVFTPVPETDKRSRASFTVSYSHYPRDFQKPKTGVLKWYAFTEAGHKFPVFSPVHVEANVQNTLKRLGMKVSSQDLWNKINSADPEQKYPQVTPASIQEFLLSWNDDYPDRCEPGVGRSITNTPFLEPENVRKLLCFISTVQDFPSNITQLPLLLTSDNVLKCFDTEEPVFTSSFWYILPKCGNKFVHKEFIYEMVLMKVLTKAKVVKRFKLEDFTAHLSEEYRVKQHINTQEKPHLMTWLRNVWKFVVNCAEKLFEFKEGTENDVTWRKRRMYIIETLGEWAVYPATVDKSNVTLIQVADAQKTLDIRGHSIDSVLHKLPLLQPYTELQEIPGKPSDKPVIPSELKLTTTLQDPVAVLEVLFSRKEQISDFVTNSTFMGEFLDMSEIVEYLSRGYRQAPLDLTKICSLCIFKDLEGQLRSLTHRKLILSDPNSLPMRDMTGIALDNNFLILSKSSNDNVGNLYKSVDPDLLADDLDIFALFILPNLGRLNEEQRMFYLGILRDKLNLTQLVEKFSPQQQRVISTLKKTPFIVRDGQLVTADNFYDHSNPVFALMTENALPDIWKGKKWRYFMTLAGVQWDLTSEQFVEYARGLHISDKQVDEKSKALFNYLLKHYETLKSRLSEIKEIEFMVPGKYEALAKLLPCFTTLSGLASLNNSFHKDFAELIWSKANIFPDYVWDCDLRQLDLMRQPPQEEIVEHIRHLCCSLYNEPVQSSTDVTSVMEHIYKHLSTCDQSVYQAMSGVPVIHLPDHGVFVTSESVIINIEDEIQPYLYRAPVMYGKYYDVFRNLGVVTDGSCDTYAQILNMMYEDGSYDQREKVKLALQGMLRHDEHLGELTVPKLYLPTTGGRLESSSEMIVTDIQALLGTTQENLEDVVLVNFGDLGIFRDNIDFVKRLPLRLRPKFLSEVVHEELLSDESQGDSSSMYQEIQETITSTFFRGAVKRVINHFSEIGSYSSPEQLDTLLDSVTVMRLNKVKTVMKLYDKEVGYRHMPYFVSDCKDGIPGLTLYISEDISKDLIPAGLSELYSRLLKVGCVDMMHVLCMVCNSFERSREIHRYLNFMKIKDLDNNQSESLLSAEDVGKYLDVTLQAHLEHGFCEFKKGEVVCMKKYTSCESDEDHEDTNIFIIVKVMRLICSYPFVMMNEYAVCTGGEEETLITVRAHQLYRLVCPQVCGESSSEARDEVSLSEVLLEIKQQVIDLWSVEDDEIRRHLLRRLLLKRDPSTNSDSTELCSRVLQYLKFLASSLEQGLPIPDDEDYHTTAACDLSDNLTTAACDLSDELAVVFKPPPNRLGMSSASSAPERLPDRREAKKWWRQATHDYTEASGRQHGSPCWIIHICFQAAEKMLKAAIYLEDRVRALEYQQGGVGHNLTAVSSSLHCADVSNLARTLQNIAGNYNDLRYPSFSGCPCDRYNNEQAREAVDVTKQLMELLSPRFPELTSSVALL